MCVNMYGYIYKTTNLVNNQIYIGQHCSEVFEPTKYIGSGVLLLKAIEKYGKNNFKNELLCECLTQEELNEKEIEYIAKYNSTDRQIGYNVSLGGLSTNFSDETKQKIAKIHRNRLCGTIIVHNGDLEASIKPELLEEYINQGYVIGRSEKAKANLSANYNYNSKGMLGKKQTEYQKEAARKANTGRKLSEEFRQNCSEAKKVKNKYVCLRTPDNTSTIRCLIKNKDYYLSLGYLSCKD